MTENLVLVTGSRTWTDGRTIIARLMEEPDGTTIVQGGARGADSLAYYAGRALGFTVITEPTEWKDHGGKAGIIRNRKMLDMRPRRVIAFCKNKSRGTMDCVKEAKKRGIPVEVIEEE